MEVCRYVDPTLVGRVGAAESDIFREIAEIEEQIRKRYTDEIEGLTERYDSILAWAALLEAEASDLWTQMTEDLEDEKLDVDPSMIPEPRDSDPVEEPLYSSERDYLEQLDHYHDWQGK